MRLLMIVAMLIGSQAYAQEKFQLAPPMLRYASAFFKDTTSFNILFEQPGTQVRYTLDGSEPGSKSLQYSRPVKISKNTIVKVKSLGNGFMPSETVTAHFFREGKAIRNISFSAPNEYYAKANKDVLFDNKGGQPNYRSGTWLGYDSDTVTIEVELIKKENVRTVYLSLLQDENSWIFLPKSIQVSYYEESSKKYVPFASRQFNHDSLSVKNSTLWPLTAEKAVTTNSLKIEMVTVNNIPEWHPGKGKHGWLFIDEIKIY